MQKPKDIMSPDVQVISPDATFREDMEHMREGDFGMMPATGTGLRDFIASNRNTGAKVGNQAMARWLTLLLAALSAPVFAQGYPVKPLRLIVGFAPGGATDIMARGLSQKMSESMGQQVIVDNRAGGGGMIAAVTGAKAPPDGYTLLMGTISTMATNVSMYSKLPYDPLRDFAPVTLAAKTPYLVVVHPSVPVTTLRGFIALAKAKPGTLNFASSGSGGGAHLAQEMFRSMAGIDLVHVPYKGAAPAMTDVLGGQVQMTFSQPPTVIPHARAGKLKVLAVSGAKRVSVFPEVPIIADAGVPGYEATSWQGIVVPAGTSHAIVNRLHDEIVKALRTPEMKERLAAEGSEPGGITPDEFALHIRREIAKWGKVVKASGAKAD